MSCQAKRWWTLLSYEAQNSNIIGTLARVYECRHRASYKSRSIPLVRLSSVAVAAVATTFRFRHGVAPPCCSHLRSSTLTSTDLPRPRTPRPQIQSPQVPRPRTPRPQSKPTDPMPTSQSRQPGPTMSLSEVGQRAASSQPASVRICRMRKSSLSSAHRRARPKPSSSFGPPATLSTPGTPRLCLRYSPRDRTLGFLTKTGNPAGPSFPPA